MNHPEYHHTSSIQSDGSRPKIRVADVHGRYTTRKSYVFSILIAIFLILPWIRFSGERLVLLWIEKREFQLFGFSFNAQDVYLIFFLVTGLAFSLFFITALVGRIWCGWTCPQTVFMEGVFRKIERLIEGSKSEQIKMAKNGASFKKTWKFLLKHFLFIATSILIATTLVLYFVPGKYFLETVENFSSHPNFVFWIVFLTGLFYFDFSWFREQVCLILCPYGRLQSALTDDDSLVIGYDQIRGEPRGKTIQDKSGDCIDCGRCVAVCPTGIDIRVGLQLECVGCANCIDACDEMMLKVSRSTGLIRYDSLNGLEGKKRKILRPRIYLYTALMIIGALVAFFNIRQRTSFEANVIRLPGVPYVLSEGAIRNQFEIHLVNKNSKPTRLQINIQSQEGIQVILPISEIELGGYEDKHIPWMAILMQKDYSHKYEMKVNVSNETDHQKISKEVEFLGPSFTKILQKDDQDQ